MWMPSSQVWVSPLAERTSSAPTIARMEATAGQKRCRMFIPDPQDSNRRRPHQDVRSRKWPGRKEEKKHAATNGGMAAWKGCSTIPGILVYTGTDETLSISSLTIIPILDERVLRGSQPLFLRLRSEEHTSLQSLRHLVCRLLLEKKKTK